MAAVEEQIIQKPSRSLWEFLGRNRKNTAVLVGGLAMVLLTVIGVQVGTRLYTVATQSPEPQKVKISNVSENSFTVSFTTDSEANTFIAYGTTPELGNATSGKKGTLHHIQVKVLKPLTTYYYKIGSGAKQYDDDGSPYTVTTAPIATVPPTPDEMYGRVVDGSGQPVSGAIVYATVKDADGLGATGSSSLLSAQTTAGGTFTIDLGNARTGALSSRFVYSREADEVKIEVEAALAGSAQVEVKTNQTQPLADIAVSPVGTTVDLRAQAPTPQQLESQETRTEEATPAAEVEEILEGSPSAQEIEEAQQAVKPTVELPASGVVDPGDVLTGKATPNTTLTITIRSEPVTAQITTDEGGNWSYTIPGTLAAGSHTITIADASGNQTTETFTLTGGVDDVATVSAEELPVAGVSLPTTLSLLVGFLLVLLGLALPRLRPLEA